MNHTYLWQKLGTTVQNALNDYEVTEVTLNPCGQLWKTHRKNGNISIGQMQSTDALTFVHALAHSAGLFLNEKKPYLDTILPFNSERINITIPPIVAGVSFNIRKRSIENLTLSDYVSRRMISTTQANFLEQAIKHRKNILVSGGPGTGKTTLTNTLLNTIPRVAPQGHRILILEDIPELHCTIENHKHLKTYDHTNMTKLLWLAMRNSPDRIIIGEVRDGAALDLLKAWNTGCPGGIATIHANSCEAALQRVKDLALEATNHAPYHLMGETIQVIVQLSLDPSHPTGRRITDIVSVNNYNKHTQSFNLTHLEADQ